MEKDYKKSGHLQSRCRRCKKTYMSYTKVPDVERALSMLALYSVIKLSETQVLPDKSIHDCADGGTGVGDYIGGLIDEDMTEERMHLP